MPRNGRSRRCSLYTARPAPEPRRIRLLTSAPERHLLLDSGEHVALLDDGVAAAGLAAVRMAAEALMLVDGRLDPAHSPSIDSGDVDLDDLRAMFPGF